MFTLYRIDFVLAQKVLPGRIGKYFVDTKNDCDGTICAHDAQVL